MAATSEETRALLQRVPAFSNLADEDLAYVAEVTVPRRFEPGEAVFHEGDQSDTCYIVRTGHVRAIREHSGGRTITPGPLRPGGTFLELAAFPHKPPSGPRD